MWGVLLLEGALGTGLGVILGSQQLQGALQPAQEQEFAFLHIQELQGRHENWEFG